MPNALRFTIVAFAISCGAMTVCAQIASATEPQSSGPKLEAESRHWQPTAKLKLKGPARSATAKQVQGPATKPAANLSSQETTDSTSSVESNAPQTVIEAPSVATIAPAQPGAAPADPGDCDYWIASSRGCDGSAVPADACRCLSFFHQTSEQNLVRVPGEAFLASIRPDRPVCFVVHGSYNRWGDVVAESRKIHRWLRDANPASPLQVVFFSWPSDGNVPLLLPVEIAILGKRSAAHGVYLAKLVTQLPREQQVCIVGHSHGARGSVAALHLLGGGRLEEGQVLPPGCTCPPHLRAVLIAAAIDHNWLNPGQRYDRALVVPERVLLMRNSRDGWLTAYQARKVFGERALGKDGLGRDDRSVLGPAGSKVVELNTAEFTNWHHSFEVFHHRPELGKAMLPYVYFQEDSPHPAAGPTLIAPASPPTPVSPADVPPPLPDE